MEVENAKKIQKKFESAEFGGFRTFSKSNLCCNLGKRLKNQRDIDIAIKNWAMSYKIFLHLVVIKLERLSITATFVHGSYLWPQL